jgi:aminoglycoside phosphotransferase (APT) family kinase protein
MLSRMQLMTVARTQAAGPKSATSRTVVSTISSTMAILTVRLTEEEERLLARRSRSAGMKKASFVRKLIREQPFETAADVLADARKRMGDVRLRVTRR